MIRSKPLLAATLLAAFLAGQAALPALASAGERKPPDQVVLSGQVRVLRGQTVGEVVVLHGSAVIGGVVRGDVVVVDGPIAVYGQVSGYVIAVNGPVTIGPAAQVGGGVTARETVTVASGAKVVGEVRQHVAYSFRGPIRAFGRLAFWLAVTVSTLLLGLLLLLLAPRGADAVFEVARTARWASVGIGLALFVGLPILAVVALASLVALPLGAVTLLALALMYVVGYVWSAWALGRALVREPRGRPLAFLAGWAILRAIGLIPFAGGATFAIGAVFGLGAMAIATWRARGAGGKHRGQALVPAPGEG